MGCGEWNGWADPLGLNDFMDPISGSANLLGFELTPVSLMTQPWNVGTYVQNDWRMLKHFLVPDMRRDREITLNGSLTPRRIIYGRTRVGMQLAYATTEGANNEYLHIIGIFCGHLINGYGSIWFGDKAMGDPAISPNVGYHLYKGDQVEACPEMVAASDGKWTAAHKLLGCAYAYFKLVYDEGVFPAGLPKITAEIEGKQVLDPRTGITAWSDNPALCAYDYMRTPAEEGGMGCAEDEIDVDAVIAAANRCDEVVT